VLKLKGKGNGSLQNTGNE